MANTADFKRKFIERLKAARIDAGYSQEQFAKELKIHRDRYAKYESRSVLPHEFLPKVCELTGFDPWFFFTGKPQFAPEERELRRHNGGQPAHGGKSA